MTTSRQQLQIGLDLVTHCDRMNDALWCVSQVLQCRHPYTYKTLMEKPCVHEDGTITGSLQPAQPGFIKQEAMSGSAIANNLKFMLTEFLSKHIPALDIDFGLVDQFVSKQAIEDDVIHTATKTAFVETNTNLCVSKADLAVVGESLENDFDFQMNRPPKPYSRAVWIANSTNNIIDAISYDLHNICQGRGTVLKRSVDEIKAWVLGRCEAGLRDAYQSSDIPEMINMLKGIQKEVPKCTDLKALSDLGDYVDSEIPKLPLVRRHWSL